MANPSESDLPDLRLRPLNDRPIRSDGAFVLYWMIGQRRLGWNFALDRAVELAAALGRPLVVFEPLRQDYPWASVRHHRFVLDGMADHQAASADRPLHYYPFVERHAGEGKGLLEALASDAAAVVTDDMVHFFYPRMLEAAARVVPVRLEAVDSHGLLPIHEPDRTFTVAHSLRRYLQKVLPDHLGAWPSADPLESPGLAAAHQETLEPLDRVRERWPSVSPDWLDGTAPGSAFGVDTSVPPVPFRGGAVEARDRLQRFLDEGLPRYVDHRNDPDAEAASRLSPYLHWGHIGTHQIVRTLMDRDGWTPADLAPKAHGKREGWWGMSAESEAFLDELVTWRELGIQEWRCRGEATEDYDTLPDWSRATLAEHADDAREHLYDLDAFDGAGTHDELWNAAQRELKREGTIHNYLRMLWGKKILEWSESPRAALHVLLELNNRYAVDGRDPNSSSGIFWVLGRYDRGWPERPVYGTVRSMSSDSTRRKVELSGYLERFGPGSS